MGELQISNMEQWECAYADSRILHDAQLIKDGASTQPSGTLFLSDVQLRLAQLRMDPSWEPVYYHNDLSPESPRDIWLASPIIDGPLNIETKKTKITYSLGQIGLSSIRDLLVVGQERLKATKEIGVTNFNRFKDALDDNEFGIPWKVETTAEDVAEICEDLSQVSAHVLDPRTGKHYRPHHFKKHGLTVLDILEAGIEERNDLVFHNFPPEWNPGNELRQQAKLFAVEFEDALRQRDSQSD